MIITIDLAGIVVICLMVAIVFFAVGLIVARQTLEAKRLGDLIEQLDEWVLGSDELLANAVLSAVRTEMVNLTPNIVAAVRTEIQRNLPTEERFRETVEAVISSARAEATRTHGKKRARHG